MARRDAPDGRRRQSAHTLPPAEQLVELLLETAGEAELLELY